MHKRWVTLLVVGLWVVGFSSVSTRGEAKLQQIPENATNVEVQWFVMEFEGGRSGYARVVAYHLDGELFTLSDTFMSIRRGAMQINIEQRSAFTETLDFVPIGFTQSMKMAGMPTSVEAEFDATNKTVKLTQQQMGNQRTTQEPWPKGDWKTPGAMAAYLKEQVEQGAERIRVASLDGSNALNPVEMYYERVGPAEVELIGRTVNGIRWQSQMSLMPGMNFETMTDEQGELLRMDIPMAPGMNMTMILADRELALSPFEPKELMLQTLIKPDKPIDQPRLVRRATFKLVPKAGQDLTGITLPETAVQKSRQEGDVIMVTIDLKGPALNQVLTDEQKAQYVNASMMLNSEDPAIHLILNRSFGQVADRLSPYGKALLLTEYVRENIREKNLNVGFATASEVARRLEGDCTEHAVLLAAMLRAAGIPSRCVSGLVYADQFAGRQDVFGYHMWTQAYLEGRWIDLDAAMPEVGKRADRMRGFDATHIALSVSDRNDAMLTNDMVKLLPLFNTFDIEVVEVER